MFLGNAGPGECGLLRDKASTPSLTIYKSSDWSFLLNHHQETSIQFKQEGRSMLGRKKICYSSRMKTMQTLKFVRNVGVICVALLALAVHAAKAAAQTQTTADVKTVLLVHGAWADGSSWSKVIPLLEAKGLHVVAVQIPLTSFADDVSATQRAIALEDGPVLLVGHSYGGAVITEAGNDPKVAGLVYVSAVAPDQ
jgi:hypothetical protein